MPTLARLCGSLSAGLCLGFALACTPRSGVERIGEGVYLRPGQHGVVFEQPALANAGFVVGERCVAVIDTGGSPAEGRALLAAVKAVSRKPVCFVVNTHVHPDHILGNLAFRSAGVEFVGHRNLARAMALLGPTYVQRAARVLDPRAGAEWLVPPDRALDAPAELDLGGRRLLLVPHAQAHTDNDVSVYDEKTGTLWAGDLLFAGHIPVLGGSGAVNGWLGVLPALERSSARTLVPGHGPLLHDAAAVIAAQRRYLVTLRDEIRAWLDSGGDIADAPARIGVSERDNWAMFDHYHGRNVSYAYTELEWEE